MQQLKGSVGAAGLNHREDVAAVQRLLAAVGVSPGAVDSRCGRRTVSAIVAFQKSFLRHPDGRIDVGGPTWRHLRGDVHAQSGLPTIFGTSTPPSVAHRSHSTPTPRLPSVAKPSGGATMRYREKLPLPLHDAIYVGFHSPGNAEMIRRFGEPRQSYGSDCRPPTNERLKAALTSMQFGITRVTGIAPAVESLRAVLPIYNASSPISPPFGIRQYDVLPVPARFQSLDYQPQLGNRDRRGHRRAGRAVRRT